MFYELFHRDWARTEHKCFIMVTLIPTVKKEMHYDDSSPDFGAADKEPEGLKDAWRLSFFKEISSKK